MDQQSFGVQSPNAMSAYMDFNRGTLSLCPTVSMRDGLFILLPSQARRTAALKELVWL